MLSLAKDVSVARVEHERCGACGFDGGLYDQVSLLDSLRALGARWRDVLDNAGSLLRVRPDPAVWSAIEYAAHSRDITALHAFGIEQALTLNEPTYAQLADDLIESAAATYCDDDPQDVVSVLETDANRMVSLAAGAGSAAWNRGLTIGDSRTDVRWLLEHGLHDSLHHLDDVERGIAVLDSASAQSGEMSRGPGEGAARLADEQAQLLSMLNQWDRANGGEPRQRDRGRYDSLIEPILTRLSSGATVASLAEYLWFEVRDHLAIDPTRSRPDLMAERLVAWYHDQAARES